MIRLAIILALTPLAGSADTLVAAHTMRAQTMLGPSDLEVIEGSIPGTLSEMDDAIGMEARVVLYAGRPIRPQDIGPAAIVDRNQIVRLQYQSNGLTMMTEGRSLGRGGPGDLIRVINLSSRTTVTGVIGPNGTVHVGPAAHVFQ